eukprot:5134580-Pleurochrysis_carterae.AAC.1
MELGCTLFIGEGRLWSFVSSRCATELGSPPALIVGLVEPDVASLIQKAYRDTRLIDAACRLQKFFRGRRADGAARCLQKFFRRKIAIPRTTERRTHRRTHARVNSPMTTRR